MEVNRDCKGNNRDVSKGFPSSHPLPYTEHRDDKDDSEDMPAEEIPGKRQELMYWVRAMCGHMPNEGHNP